MRAEGQSQQAERALQLLAATKYCTAGVTYVVIPLMQLRVFTNLRECSLPDSFVSRLVCALTRHQAQEASCYSHLWAVRLRSQELNFNGPL
ncbi:hypothetical protein MASSI9I_60379 [Massilia sp. 9I]|nr:hypothetical protein MASSI9I_60379 [Massilia sp. 9I]